MRASTIIALSVAAGSASYALAAPHHASRQESGALSFDDIKNGAKTVFDDVTKVAQTVTPIITTASKVVDTVAPFFERREDAELFARALLEARADESGALSWQDVKDFGTGFVNGFTGTLNTVLPAVNAVTDLVGAVSGKDEKREDLELLARAIFSARDGESGALSFQDVKDFGKGFVDGFTGTLNTVLPAVNAVTDAVNAFTGKEKRDEGEFIGLVARAAIGEFRGIGPIRLTPFNNLPTFQPGGFVGNTNVARQTPSASPAASVSGALNLQDVKDFGKGFVDGFTGTLKTLAPLAAAFVKREELELLAREELLRRADATSGAISLQDVKDFGKGFVQGFTGTIEKLAPLAVPFLKREELELVARESLLNAYAKRSTLADLD